MTDDSKDPINVGVPSTSRFHKEVSEMYYERAPLVGQQELVRRTSQTELGKRRNRVGAF